MLRPNGRSRVARGGSSRTNRTVSGLRGAVRFFGLGRCARAALLQQALELGADEVTGGDLAERDTHGGDLAGEVLGVRDGPVVLTPVLFELHAVAVGVPVLREKDQGGGVRRLKRQDQRQQRVVEVAWVELQVVRSPGVPE